MKRLILDLIVFFLFLILVFLLRWPVFHWSVVDWDESMYLIGGRAWLHGGVPYVAVWGQPGIFGLFAIAQWLFGEHVESIRIAANIAVATSSFLLFLFGVRIFHNRWHALLPALMYSLFSMANGGLASNIEIFYTPLVIACFYLLETRIISSKNSSVPKWTIFWIGMLLSISLQLKYLMIFEGSLVSLIILYYANVGTRLVNWKNILEVGLILSGSLLSTFVILSLHLFANNALDDYLHFNLRTVFSYSSERSFSEQAFLDAILYLLKSNVFLWSLVILAFAGRYLFNRFDWAANGKFPLLFFWMAAAFIGALFTKRFYPHYFLPLLPPMCLIASYTSVQAIRNLAEQLKFKWLVVLGLAALSVAALQFSIYLDKPESKLLFGGVASQTDTPRVIAQRINEQIDSSDYIYVANYQPVLYYLVRARIPTRFVFTQHLSSDPPVTFLPVDPIQEFERIMALKPKFIVLANHTRSPYFDRLYEFLIKDYEQNMVVESDMDPDKSYGLKTIFVYKLKSD